VGRLLANFLDRIEQRHGRDNRIWVMDRGVPTEDSLTKMRHIGASYLVGTPKGRLNKLECGFLAQPWARVREGAQIRKILDHIGVACEPPRIAPARGPPLWEDCDAKMDDGAQIEPDWDRSAQAAPDYEVDQRVSW
jgi:hypothetical protein